MTTEALQAEDTQLESTAGVWRLRRDVVTVRRSGTLLLMSRTTGASVRMTRVASELLPLLDAGTDFTDMVSHLQSQYPNARDIESKLDGFLSELAGVGLVEGAREHKLESVRRRYGPQFEIFDPDRLAEKIARCIHAVPAPLAWLTLFAGLAGAVAGIGALAAAGKIPHPSSLVVAFDVVGLAIFVLAVVPVHEIAHAIACRTAGAPVRSAGIILHGWIVPGPFVNTSHAYQLRDKWRRFWIPAAGPLVDLLAVGASAWVLAAGLGGEAVAESAAFVFVLCTVFLYLDTNPLTPSDGSKMVEALLDDELARRAAFRGARSSIAVRRNMHVYRLVSIAHASIAAIVLYLWWTGTTL